MRRLLFASVLLGWAMAALAQQSPFMTPMGWVWDGRDQDLTFEWHGESTKAEFSIGDDTALLNGAAVITNTVAYDGASSLYCPTLSDYAAFDVTGNDLWNQSGGSVDIMAYIESYANTASIFWVYCNSTNNLYIQLRTNDVIRMTWKGMNTNTTVETTDTFSTGAWFRVTASWRTNASPYLSIAINGGTPVTSGTLPTIMDASPTYVRFGEATGRDVVGYIDNMLLYKVWK